MKRYLLLILVCLSFSGFAQNTINNYQYAIVPEKMSFLKEKDQYRLNTLLKLYLDEKGFKTFYDSAELPPEVAANKCAALKVDVTEKKTMFTTKLTFVMKDCLGNTVFTSKEGISREKEYKTAYNLALRDALTSLDEAHYAYNGAAAQQIDRPSAPAPVPTPVKADAAPAQPATTQTVNIPAGTLYAQPTATGYQLIDTTPKIVLTLFKTSGEDYFIAENNNAHGIVFKKNGEWFFEYYNNGKLTTDKLAVKF